MVAVFGRKPIEAIITSSATVPAGFVMVSVPALPVNDADAAERKVMVLSVAESSDRKVGLTTALELAPRKVIWAWATSPGVRPAIAPMNSKKPTIPRRRP